MLTDKIILVYYVGVEGLPFDEINKYLDNLAKKLSDDNDKYIIKYFCPIATSREVKIECIYPRFIALSDSEMENFKQLNNIIQKIESNLEKKDE